VLELDGKAKYGAVEPDQVPQPWLAEKVRYDRMGNLGLERIRLGLGDLLGGSVLVRRTVQTRRGAGSFERFSGRFRVTDPTGLRSFRVPRRGQ
jgi:hypothetical protein